MNKKYLFLGLLVFEIMCNVQVNGMERTPQRTSPEALHVARADAARAHAHVQAQTIILKAEIDYHSAMKGRYPSSLAEATAEIDIGMLRSKLASAQAAARAAEDRVAGHTK